MDGGSLDRYGALNESVLRPVTVSIVNGLQYLWQNKIMHRGNCYLYTNQIVQMSNQAIYLSIQLEASNCVILVFQNNYNDR